MIYFVSFVILLSVLVFVHELGHFLVAKWAGVRVDAFAIGFGKALWKKQIGETEYRIGILPLGGYVKVYGQDGGDIDPIYEQFSFSSQKWYIKAAIAFAGPAFNLVFAFLVYISIFMIGNPELSNKIGTVFPETPIYEAGVQTGDKITKINGIKVQTWKKIDNILSNSTYNFVNLEINENKRVELPVVLVPSKNRYGQAVLKKSLYGLSPMQIAPLIAVSKNSFFDKLGFKTGDFIKSINGTKIKDFNELDNYFIKHQKQVVSVNFLRGKDDASIALTVPSYEYKACQYTESITDTYCSFLNHFGVFIGELVVNKILANDPADGVLKEKDIIIAVDGKIARSHYFLQNFLQGKSLVSLLINRDGEFIEVEISPKKTQISNGSLYTLGIMNYAARTLPDIIKIKLPFGQAFVSGFKETIEWIKITVVGFGKLITGKVSSKNLGGPMMIGKVAGDSLSKGISYFLKVLAIISINLGLINLFPIPVLDGGLLILAFYEGIMRRPMKEKILSIIQQIGVVLLLFLVAFSLFNDIGRFLK